MMRILRDVLALLVAAILSGSQSPCGTSEPPPDMLRLSLAFAKEDNFNKFVLLAPDYNKNPEFEYRVLVRLETDCNILENHKVPTAALVTRDLFSRIEGGLKEENVPEGYDRDSRFLLIKWLYRDSGLDESATLRIGHLPYLCLIKIPNSIFPPEGTDFFEYLERDNDVNTLVIKVCDSIANDSGMVFVKNGSGIVWGYRKHP